jgi:hypothetical protein
MMPEKILPQAAFLGFAERSEQVRDAETVSLKWNVLGLKNVLLVNFLPIPLIGWKVGGSIAVFRSFKACEDYVASRIGRRHWLY